MPDFLKNLEEHEHPGLNEEYTEYDSPKMVYPKTVEEVLSQDPEAVNAQIKALEALNSVQEDVKGQNEVSSWFFSNY
jgi:hypothetical protein